MAGDLPSKTAWEAENVVVARAKINRNQDPALYQYLSQAPSRSQAVRELLRAGLANIQNQEAAHSAKYGEDWELSKDNPCY